MPYVKTVDLQPGVQHQGWAFCPVCYGNLVTEKHETTDANGEVCPRCDGVGTLWRIASA